MIFSMTAFSKQQKQHTNAIITWELRSVNSRYLDISFHIPEQLRELEMTLRKVIKKYITRGKVDCCLDYQPVKTNNCDFVLNKDVVKKLKILTELVKENFDQAVIVDSMKILKFPGVMQIVRKKTEESVKDLIINQFEEAIIKLKKMRETEGSGLKKTIQDRLKLISKEIEKAKTQIPDILEKQRQGLIKRFNDAKLELNTDRLEQEMLMLIQKMDVSEEIDRLSIHVEEAEKLLQIGGVVGRRLNFLMQEFHREANTLSSKSISNVTTQVGIELKVLIEQMREQIQNIE